VKRRHDLAFGREEHDDSRDRGQDECACRHVL
jgi:hypothetical protein